MTEHGHNFIREIAEAYRALESEPVLHSRIAELESKLNDAQEHSQRLELRLIDRANEISDLQSKLRSVEAERDDATFREMAASDKANAVRDAFQLIREAANEAVVVLTGSKKTDMVFVTPSERQDWEQHKADKAAEAAAMERRAEEQAKAIAKVEEAVAVFPTPAPEPVTGTGTEAVAFVSEPTTAAPSTAYASDGTISPGEETEGTSRPVAPEVAASSDPIVSVANEACSGSSTPSDSGTEAA
jgi:hypothetical protein